jgi:hypothetical protein
MAYTAQLQHTARTAWGTWHDASAMACRVTATAWDWYTGAFFSPAAQRRYEEIGRYVWLVSAFVFGLGVLARRWVARSEFQAWIDAQVGQALPAPVAPVVDTPAQPAEITAPVVSVTVPSVEPETPLADLGIRQLKTVASAAKVKGYGRMSKAQLIAALEELQE